MFEAYEDRAISLQPTSAILVRVMIGSTTWGGFCQNSHACRVCRI